MSDLIQQLECIRREVSMRRRVYPRLVEAGRMTRANAHYEIQTMEDVIDSLEWLRRRGLDE